MLNDAIEVIKSIYSNSISRAKLEKTGQEINICRGVRQGDPLSPIIFMTVLQKIMKHLNWSKKGHGSYRSNLRFSDDIVLFAETATQLESIINDIFSVSRRIDFELNTKQKS